MPLSKDLLTKFSNISEELANQLASSLSLLLNSQINFEALTVADASQINPASTQLLSKINFQDTNLGSLEILSNLENANQIACLMMGSKELNEFDSVKQDAFNSALEQSFKEVIKLIQNNNVINFKAISSEQVADAASFGADGNIFSVKLQTESFGGFEVFISLSDSLVQTIMGMSEAAGNNNGDNKTVGDYLGTSFAEMVDTHNPDDIDEKKNLNLLMDIRMGLIVELGRAEMHLKDILKLTKGSIIELDRLSGEPVDLFVNNKLIARGEVVVIDDNFGLRITQLAGVQNSREVELGLVD